MCCLNFKVTQRLGFCPKSKFPEHRSRSFPQRLNFKQKRQISTLKRFPEVSDKYSLRTQEARKLGRRKLQGTWRDSALPARSPDIHTVTQWLGRTFPSECSSFNQKTNKLGYWRCSLGYKSASAYIGSWRPLCPRHPVSKQKSYKN